MYIINNTVQHQCQWRQSLQRRGPHRELEIGIPVFHFPSKSRRNGIGHERPSSEAGVEIAIWEWEVMGMGGNVNQRPVSTDLCAVILSCGQLTSKSQTDVLSRL